MVDIYSLWECTKSVKKIYLILETDKIVEIENLDAIMKKYKDVEFVIIDFYHLKTLFWCPIPLDMTQRKQQQKSDSLAMIQIALRKKVWVYRIIPLIGWKLAAHICHSK